MGRSEVSGSKLVGTGGPSPGGTGRLSSRANGNRGRRSSPASWDREEINLTLSGPYDERPAIVTIQAGAGGTDSQDWAEMLLRMYLRWAETQARPVQVMDLSYGDEAGLRSGTLGGRWRLR